MLRKILFGGIAMIVMAAPAVAGEFSAVSTIDKAVSSTNEDGSVSIEYVNADRVIPGDTLHCRIAYANETDEAVDEVDLVMNVPSEVIFSENSARLVGEAETLIPLADLGISVSFSTDNGTSFAPRGDLTVTVAGQDRSAVSEDITNVRFTFAEPIPAGQSGSVMFTAIVR